MADNKKDKPKAAKLNVTERSNREIESVIDVAKVVYIIKNHLQNKPIYFKNYPQSYSTKIRQILEDSAIEITVPAEIKVEEKMTLYAILNKFVEIDVTYLRQVDENVYHFTITGSNIAKSNRQNIRFKVEKGDIFINHIKTSRHIINADLYSIPTSVKVIMHQHEPFLKPLADEVTLAPFDDTNSKHRLIKKTLKTYYVRDFTDDSSYEPLNEDFINIREHLQNNLDKAKRHYKAKGVKGEILTPILYIASDEETIPLGIIHMVSHSSPLEIDKVLEAKEVSFQIVDKIRAANTLIINKRQDILDIGRGGAKIEITDPELKKNLIHQKGLSFDLYFKLQAPITLSATIQNHYWDSSENLFLGINFTGRTARKEDIKRLHQMIEPLEKEFSAQLAQKIASQK